MKYRMTVVSCLKVFEQHFGITSTFNAVCFEKILSNDSAKNKTETVKCFDFIFFFIFSHFYWSFSSEIMAVKGLKALIHEPRRPSV